MQPGYRVIAADLPGSGRSLPHPGQYPAMYYQGDDIPKEGKTWSL